MESQNTNTREPRASPEFYQKQDISLTQQPQSQKLSNSSKSIKQTLSDAPPPQQNSQATIPATDSVMKPSQTIPQAQYSNRELNQHATLAPVMQHETGYQQIPSQYREHTLNLTGQIQQSQPSMQHQERVQHQLPYEKIQSWPQPQGQGKSTTQPVPVQGGMQYVPMTEEELKKQKRKEQLAKVRHHSGQCCIVTGKACVIAGGVMMAVCSVVSCCLSCLPGDGGGVVGGGPGFSGFGMPD